MEGKMLCHPAEGPLRADPYVGNNWGRSLGRITFTLPVLVHARSFIHNSIPRPQWQSTRCPEHYHRSQPSLGYFGQEACPHGKRGCSFVSFSDNHSTPWYWMAPYISQGWMFSAKSLDVISEIFGLPLHDSDKFVSSSVTWTTMLSSDF